MHELINIFKDVKSGALPLSEVPGFMVWAVKKSRRVFWLALLVAATVLWMRGRMGR